MKRLRVERWSRQVLGARSGGLQHQYRSSRPSVCPPSARQFQLPIRPMSAAADAQANAISDSAELSDDVHVATDSDPSLPDRPYPSPLPERALQSAKLAALHARLNLSEKIPLQTLARTLVDASADPNPRFNNVNLAFLGSSLISYHMAEWLVCRFPRLPMEILYQALRAYGGPASLNHVARQWGVERAAAPGEEVDPGLLQYDAERPGVVIRQWGYERGEQRYIDKYKWRRGLSSRVVLDDEFGDAISGHQAMSVRAAAADDDPARPMAPVSFSRDADQQAHAAHVRAVVGAVYAHCGRAAVAAFVRAHVLSRRLDLASLFQFKHPLRELAMLCAREDFDRPIARLESETGRLSRTPVFVVGIYSGRDKLGEGAAYSLNTARLKASMNALKSWYLYSPGEHVRVPSEMTVDGSRPWEPVYIDMGEIISS